MTTPRFAIGIDLGTTHTALAYVDLDLAEGDEAPSTIMKVPQLVSRGSLESRALLPSFLYLPHDSEGRQPLPWDDSRAFAVGEYARSRGIDAPTRVVSSAKSWLCHPSIDRRSAILPPSPQGASDTENLAKISPVEASRRFLEHLREAWDAQIAQGAPDKLFANQDIVLTVPASFDAAARELTAEAARLAGIANLTLVEEPQAALYSWIEQSHGEFRKNLRVGDLILVVDVGGGTTDFSAIAVRDEGGAFELHRVAVGDHILLGGDNMDLALAHALSRKLATPEGGGKQLDAWQMQSLVHACRAAKEQLFVQPDLQVAPIAIAARGSKLVGGTIRTELARNELSQLLVDGFFPVVESSAVPVTRARAGLLQFGLSYAQDAAITRHLAQFLTRQAHALDKLEGAVPSVHAFLQPTAILFNGGVMKADQLRERVLSAVDGWLSAAGAPPVRVLDGADLDLSVARGAAYYGYVRRGRGIRIRGGTARAYYVGIEDAMPAVPGLEPPLSALCVAPFGIEEGSRAGKASNEFGLVVGEPVRFRFFGSTVRRDDQVGSVLHRWTDSELEELAPIEATLPAENRRAGEVVPVHLESTITEVGTLLIEAVDSSGQRQWKLELNVRGH